MANGFERGARLLTGSQETIAEFRVQTSDYQAQYGRAAGSFVNVASKSGTNQFHGTLFDYFRNNFLDARNFFNTNLTSKPSSVTTISAQTLAAAEEGQNFFLRQL